jgi:hypothetical protein
MKLYCWGCEREVSVPEGQEFARLTDRPLEEEVYCRACCETRLRLCMECSARYAEDEGGLCGVCSEQSCLMVADTW